MCCAVIGTAYIENCAEPVSYTHLDVYKRQDSPTARTIMFSSKYNIILSEVFDRTIHYHRSNSLTQRFNS